MKEEARAARLGESCRVNSILQEKVPDGL